MEHFLSFSYLFFTQIYISFRLPPWYSPSSTSQSPCSHSLVPPSARQTAETASSQCPCSHSLVPPSARQTAETAPSQCPCSHPLVPLLANEACTKQIRHASLSYSFQATAASSVATSAVPGLSIVTHPKGLPDSTNSRTRIQNLLGEYKATNALDSFIWLSIMRYPWEDSHWIYKDWVFTA